MNPGSIIILAASSAGIYVALLVLMVLGQRLLTFPWWIDALKSPDENMAEAGFSEAAIETNDGKRLNAYWLPPREGSPVVLTLHGIRGWHWLQALRFSRGHWAEAGCGVLAPAFRGYHGSTGWPSERGLLLDAEAALAFIRANAPGSEIILHGHSLGSGVATATAARFACKALILEAPFTSLPDVGARWYPIMPVRRFMQDMLPTAKLIKWAKTDRIIIIHGTADRLIPMSMGEQVAMARDGIQFIPLEGIGHMDLYGLADKMLLSVVAIEEKAVR